MFKYSLTWLLQIAICFCAAPLIAETSETHCDAVDVTIWHPQPSDPELTCDGAEAAISFLESIGLQQQELIEIHLVPELPFGQHEAIGC